MPTSPNIGLQTSPSGTLEALAAAWLLTTLPIVARMNMGLHWIDKSISSINGSGAPTVELPVGSTPAIAGAFDMPG